MTRVVTIAIEGRPPLLNAERSKHWRQHRETTRTYRTAAAIQLGKEGRKGTMGMVKVDVWSTYDNRVLPDTAACLPAVKAVIDGAVDAGLLTNDTPNIVKHVAFWAPITDTGIGNQLMICFEELEEASPWAR